MNESGPSQNEQLTESLESKAVNKFREIWKKIEDTDHEIQYIENKDDVKNIITINTGVNAFWTFINIHKEPDNSDYNLAYDWQRFTLAAGPVDGSKIFVNPEPEDLLGDIFPNFDRRINEENIYYRQQRQQKIQEANQFAELKEREANESMMNQAISNPDIRRSMG